MNKYVLDVIVAGAGHAGLSASYFLKQSELTHIVFERGKIGESWRSKRWNNFVLNTPNKFNVLPGNAYDGNDPDGFSSAGAFVSMLENYAKKFQLPVSENTSILSIEKNERSGLFKVIVVRHDNLYTYYSRQVIIASGETNEPRIPVLSKQVAPDIKQMHTSEYKTADFLPEGAVLVVGSAQSGCQIAEDLVLAGRKVYLSTSQVGRLPRKYRRRDIMDWLFEMQFFDVKKEDLPDATSAETRAPQLTGRDNGKRTISLQALSKKGVAILGRLETIAGNGICFQGNAGKHIQFADEFSYKVKTMIDGFILHHNLQVPLAETDAADIPDLENAADSGIKWLETAQHNIGTIIWSTGFGADFNYIKLPVFDKEGRPVHTNGISSIDGLYFTGLHWLRSRKSGLIAGAKDDAAFICRYVAEHAFSNISVAV